MDWQMAAAYAAMGVAGAYLALQGWRQWSGRSSGCGGGCAGRCAAGKLEGSGAPRSLIPADRIRMRKPDAPGGRSGFEV
jgi:hypothetical protein